MTLALAALGLLLAMVIAAVALAHGQHQHGGVVAGVQPRIWLRHDVSPLQMSPPR